MEILAFFELKTPSTFESSYELTGTQEEFKITGNKNAADSISVLSNLWNKVIDKVNSFEIIFKYPLDGEIYPVAITVNHDGGGQDVLNVSIQYNSNPLDLIDGDLYEGEELNYFTYDVDTGKVIIKYSSLETEDALFRVSAIDRSGYETKSEQILSAGIKALQTWYLGVELINDDISSILTDENIKVEEFITLELISGILLGEKCLNIELLYKDPLLTYSNEYCAECFVEFSSWADLSDLEKSLLLFAARTQILASPKLVPFEGMKEFSWFVIEQAYFILSTNIGLGNLDWQNYDVKRLGSVAPIAANKNLNIIYNTVKYKVN